MASVPPRAREPRYHPQAALEQGPDRQRPRRARADAGRRRRRHRRRHRPRQAGGQRSRLFIRSLVGMDREAAKQAFGVFLTGRTPSANQIEFVNLIVDHLTEHGVMEPARLYESPFTDINPRGPEGMFTEPQVDELVSVLKKIRQTAAA